MNTDSSRIHISLDSDQRGAVLIVAEKLQMRGESIQVQLVKQFIMQLGLGSLIQGLIKKIKGGKAKTKPTEADLEEKK
ncbi:hypothetical protein R0K04_28205, partial [Pseudoalteromonas sp. SIMBA_153]